MILIVREGDVAFGYAVSGCGLLDDDLPHLARYAIGSRPILHPVVFLHLVEFFLRPDCSLDVRRGLADFRLLVRRLVLLEKKTSRLWSRVGRVLSPPEDSDEKKKKKVYLETPCSVRVAVILCSVQVWETLLLFRAVRLKSDRSLGTAEERNIQF
jgi:hypothetical protein